MKKIAYCRSSSLSLASNVTTAKLTATAGLKRRIRSRSAENINPNVSAANKVSKTAEHPMATVDFATPVMENRSIGKNIQSQAPGSSTDCKRKVRGPNVNKLFSQTPLSVKCSDAEVTAVGSLCTKKTPASINSVPGLNNYRRVSLTGRVAATDSNKKTQFQLPTVNIPQKKTSANLTTQSSSSNCSYEHGRLNKPAQSTDVTISKIYEKTLGNKRKEKKVSHSSPEKRNLMSEFDDVCQYHSSINDCGDREHTSEPNNPNEYEVDHADNEDISYHPDLWTGYMDIGPPTRKCGKCGATMWNEERNNKTCTRQDATFSLCCRNGQVHLDKEPPPPEPLASLLSGDTAGFRDTVVNSKQEGLKRIYETDPHFMQFQYPLLFPWGNEGYHVRIPLRNNKQCDSDDINDEDLDPDSNGSV